MYSLCKSGACINVFDNVLTKKAISLITTTDKSIKEIADMLNFPNASAFGTFFKKQVGMSPVNYRQKEK